MPARVTASASARHLLEAAARLRARPDRVHPLVVRLRGVDVLRRRPSPRTHAGGFAGSGAACWPGSRRGSCPCRRRTACPRRRGPRCPRSSSSGVCGFIPPSYQNVSTDGRSRVAGWRQRTVLALGRRRATRGRPRSRGRRPRTPRCSDAPRRTRARRAAGCGTAATGCSGPCRRGSRCRTRTSRGRPRTCSRGDTADPAPAPATAPS